MMARPPKMLARFALKVISVSKALLILNLVMLAISAQSKAHVNMLAQLELTVQLCQSKPLHALKDSTAQATELTSMPSAQTEPIAESLPDSQKNVLKVTSDRPELITST